MKTKNEKSSCGKKFPTLVIGLAVVLVSVVLIGGKSIALDALGQTNDTVTDRQTANVNVATLAAVNNRNTNNKTAKGATAEVRGGVQYVTSTFSSSRYEPITVQQEIPVKWTLNAPSNVLNGCNDAIVIPEYNLNIDLKAGENIIEFTPDKSGTFAFSCWMGMIRSSITVVREDGTVADNADDGSNQLPVGCGMQGGGYAGGNSGGGCCSR